MHELSVALSLVDLACEEARRLGGVRIHALHVNVGALSGVVKEALAFAFDAAANGTEIEGARLEVHEIPVTVWCDACASEHILLHLQPRKCPVCASPTPRLLAGDDLLLASLEVEDVHANR